jgi:branched-chain amino acid transport system ATP-binding protein
LENESLAVPRENILVVRDLKVSYAGGITVVWGISFDVKGKEIVSVIGSNGAGKTTTIKTLSGLMRPTAGDISFLGEQIVGKASHDILNMGLVQIPEGRELFPQMSVFENLVLGAYPKKFRAYQKENFKWVLDLFPRLAGRLKQKAGSMSGGEQQMLAIGRALMCRPKILLLDEPSMGLAPLVVSEIFKTIARLREVSRTTIFLVEQNARAALKLSDRGYVMETGKIMFEADAADLLENKEVQRAYLGKEKKPIWA